MLRNLIACMLETAGVDDYHLYHVTSPHKALSILKLDALRLPLAKTNPSEELLASKRKGKTFYMSFARSVTSGYIADRAPGLYKVSDSILLVVDKPKLAKQRGVIFEQVQYFGALDSTGRQGGNGRETEERLFSPSPILKGIIHALVEIRIYLGKDREHPAMREILSFAKKRGIPIKLFSEKNFSGFLLGKEKPEDRKEVFDIIKNEKADGFPSPRISDMYNSRLYHKKHGTKLSDNYGIKRLITYVYETKYEVLNDKQRSALYHLTWDSRSFKEGFQSDLHNLRGGNPSEQDLFNRMMKFMRATDSDDFFNKLYIKWKKLRDDYNRDNK